MAQELSLDNLQSLLEGDSPFALIDVREPGEYNSAHIPGSSLIPRRRLEFDIPASLPFKGVRVVICDDDGHRARLAAATLEEVGYTQVFVLGGGTNRWTSQGYPTEWGVNVPSKDFGEKMEVVHHVPELEATELHQLMEQGKKLVILDTRTPEEYQRFCIPGGRSVPGGELALRITDITRDLDEDTTVVVNCAGRTRSIIGTRVLQRMGLNNIYGLKNGTSGWVLAGYDLESGADRTQLPEVSPAGLAAAETYAEKLAKEDGIRYLDIAALQAMMRQGANQTIYFIDVRNREEYQQGHIPGFRWFPGGQAVQRSDELAVVKNTPIVFTCDGKVRGTVTASWYRQMGHQEVYVVDGGTSVWAEAGLQLEKGLAEPAPFGLAQAREKVKLVSPRELQASSPSVTIFVDTSQDFIRGHVPGSRWAPRGWLEHQISDYAPDKSATVAVTCNDGQNSTLAGATLTGLGYQKVLVLEGGIAAWQQAGMPLEQGLTGVMRQPADMVFSGPDRTYADMINYLRWEEELGHKYQTASD
jgi:rhodanese-related sulfurtransferase